MLISTPAATRDREQRRPADAKRPAAVAGSLIAIVSVVALTSCTGKSAVATGSTSAAPASPAARADAPGPPASGEIAAVAGTTMQVQSQVNGQVAVTWTSSTKFTQQVSVSPGAIKAGDCVTALATTGTSATATTFSASTVTVNAATGGTCQAGFGGRGSGGGAPPSGFPSRATPPSGFPSGATPPSGFPSGRPGGAARTAIASGSVVSVTGSSIVVAARDFTPGSANTNSRPTTNKTVTLTSQTKVLATRTATSGAVKVGRCATAEGKTDSAGAVTATMISITEPVAGTCTGGFGGFGGRPGAGSGGTGGTGG